MDSKTKAMFDALQLAALGRYTVSPNPLVGCVIMKNGQMISQGFHHTPGQAHAEIYALEAAGAAARGATAYVNLEPCCHYGKTPPCTKALIQAGIRTVYIACQDPNPLVNGQGILQLRKAGINVHVGLCEKEALKCNAFFFHYITHKRPFVISKWAMSLDGQTITASGDSAQLSCSASYEHLHEIRQRVDAILIGTNTAYRDNPQLTARPRGSQIMTRSTESKLKQPQRIILSTNAKHLPLNLNLFETAKQYKTIVIATKSIRLSYQKALEKKGVVVWILPSNHSGKIELLTLLNALGEHNISSLLVEGGMNVHQQFFQQNLINEIHVYLTPVLIGKNIKKQRLRKTTCEKIGEDWHISVNVSETQKRHDNATQEVDKHV